MVATQRVSGRHGDVLGTIRPGTFLVRWEGEPAPVEVPMGSIEFPRREEHFLTPETLRNGGAL